MTIGPPRRVLPMIRQSWRDVSFLHWPFDPVVVQRALPPRLTIDTHEGAAWVSIVCFSTTCSVAGPVPLPGPRRFPETNVRTYVRGPDGADGLYFFSLDVTNRANVALGRAIGLRYRLADMEVSASDQWSYVGTRRDGSGAGYEIVVEPAAGDAANPLQAFLTDRWSAYVPLGSLRRAAIYPLDEQAVKDEDVREALEAVGLGHLKDRMDEESAWEQSLSGGEKQRLAFARLLIHKPDLIVMDEATSALDPGSQEKLMQLINERIPNATLISVGHRPELEAYHGRKLVLEHRTGGARLIRDEVLTFLPGPAVSVLRRWMRWRRSGNGAAKTEEVVLEVPQSGKACEPSEAQSAPANDPATPENGKGRSVEMMNT